MVKLKIIQSFYKGFVTIALLFSTSFANAVIIESELTFLSGNSYKYDFNVINNDLAAGLEGFSVFFDETLFENLSVLGSHTDWDSIVIQPDTGIPAPGFFDSLYQVDPLAIGDSVAGFSVGFDWLGALNPPVAGNPFEVYRLSPSFDIVASGVTTSIPEPGLLSLFGLALLFVGARKRIG